MTNNKITYKGIVEQEINCILATKVMGWHKEEHWDGSELWIDETDAFMFACEDWSPLTNPSQALMCEDKLDVQQKLWYIAHLRELMHERCTKNGITNASMQNYEMVHANAEERCHALLKAIGEKE